MGREKGLSHAAAAGFVGSEQGENNFKAHGYGDRGAAYGSMMWQGPRRRQILNGMGLNVIGATHRRQLEAAHWEMTKGPDAGARRAWQLAQAAKTPGEAAAIHVDHYERPLDRVLNKRVRGGYANAWAKRFEDAAQAPAKLAQAPAAVAKATTAGSDSAAKLTGARALGGPVSGGRSYLVGERGPEIFTPGLSGAISTNDTFNGLTAAGQALSGLADSGVIRPEGEGGLAAKLGQVAKVAQSGSRTLHLGDKTLSVNVQTGDGASPVEIARVARSELMSLLRQMESDQRGLLSD